MSLSPRLRFAAAPDSGLKTAGFVETVVVTARRAETRLAETRLAETPQKIEVIASVDFERSVAADLTDVLKKNAGVDVVQYSGVLSGDQHPRLPAADWRHQQASVMSAAT